MNLLSPFARTTRRVGAKHRRGAHDFRNMDYWSDQRAFLPIHSHCHPYQHLPWDCNTPLCTTRPCTATKNGRPCDGTDSRLSRQVQTHPQRFVTMPATDSSLSHISHITTHNTAVRGPNMCVHETQERLVFVEIFGPPYPLRDRQGSPCFPENRGLANCSGSVALGRQNR